MRKASSLRMSKAGRSLSQLIDTSTIILRSSAFATERYWDFVKRGILKPREKAKETKPMSDLAITGNVKSGGH